MINLNWPDGATHCNREGTSFHDFSNGGHRHWLNAAWVRHSSKFEDYDTPGELVERQQPKPWSGPEDGLPPVGTVCEWKYADSQTWKATKILYIGSVYVIVPAHYGEQHYYVQHMQFRAVKTPEQQAAQLRETAIRELIDIAQVDCRVTAARLVDAGFKREVK